MGRQDHSTGTIGNAIRRVRADVVKELGYCTVGVLCGLSLLGADGAEGGKELVVNRTRVVEQGANNALDTFEGGLVSASGIRCSLAP